MTNDRHQVPLAANFPAAAAASSNVRRNRAHPAAAANVAKRTVHTTLIDDAWDLKPAAASASQSGAHRIEARPLRTSQIGAEWDQPPNEPVTQAAGSRAALARPPHTTLIDAQWDFDDAASVPRALQTSIVDVTWEELEATEILDWDAPWAAQDHRSAGAESVPPSLQSSIVELKGENPQTMQADESEFPATVARAPQTSLIDSEWDSLAAEPPLVPKVPTLPQPIVIAEAAAEHDPVITFVRLDNPESLLGLLRTAAHK